jgi:organic radical activating enzyme
MITTTKKQDSLLYHDCHECHDHSYIIYPYELSYVTEFARSYVNNHQVTFITNANCNINCRHCFCPAAFPGQKPGFISKEIVDKTFDIIGDRKILISILGGEVMLYPDGCKYIADKAHERGLTFRIITNGFFGNDDKMVDFLINQIKPEITTISFDEYHQEFIPEETIKNLINKIYGKTEVIIESCINIQNSDFKFNAEPVKIEIAKKLDLENKKIFYMIDPIKKDGNARTNDLGYEKLVCEVGHCSACGFVVSFTGAIAIKCEFNSRPIHKDCKLWSRNILTDDYNLEDFFSFLDTKRYWINDLVITEISALLHPDKYSLEERVAPKTTFFETLDLPKLNLEEILKNASGIIK